MKVSKEKRYTNIRTRNTNQKSTVNPKNNMEIITSFEVLYPMSYHRRYGPQTQTECRLEAELVALSQVSHDEMTRVQAERIRELRLEFRAFRRNDTHIGASRVPTVRNALSAALRLREPTPWDNDDAYKTEYRETIDGTQHLLIAECNIPISCLYLSYPNHSELLYEISDLRELIINTREQWQLFLLRAADEYRAVDNTLPANEQQLILISSGIMESQIQQWQQREQELTRIYFKFWEEEKARQRLTPEYKEKRRVIARRIRKVVVEDISPENRACGICREAYLGCESPENLATYGPGEQPVQLLCGHKFGKTCVSAWVKDHTTCPMCRHDYRMVPNGSSSQEDAEEEDLSADEDEDDECFELGHFNHELLFGNEPWSWNLEEPINLDFE